MTADSTAEKAAESDPGGRLARSHGYKELAATRDFTGHIDQGRRTAYYEGFKTGRASRDAEVAELQGIVNQAIPLPAAQDLIDERDALREQLAEAQATIEKIYEIRHRRITWHGLSVSEEAAIDAALAGALAGNALLSAPSSTGGGEKPKTVCLCGSTRFRAEIAEANRSLTMQGYMVLAPGVFGHDGDPLTDDDKMRLDKLHFSKIDASDRVHVVNPGGYIGESTRREIEYAKAKGKPVTYRHESSTGGNFRDDLKSRESRRSDVDFDTATNRPLGGDDHE